MVLQAAGPAKLLEELLQSPAEPLECGTVEREGCSPTMLILVILSCCLGACLAMQPIADGLLRAAAGPLGMTRVSELESGHRSGEKVVGQVEFVVALLSIRNSHYAEAMRRQTNLSFRP